MKKTLNILKSSVLFIFDSILPSIRIDINQITNELNITKEYRNFGHINLFSYKSKLIKECIWLIKFKNNRKLSGHFSRIIHDVLLEELDELKKFNNFSDPVLIKVPSSKDSLNERGYDHNLLFIRDLIKSKEIKFMDVLIKKKNNLRQSHFKSRKDRMRNSFGSYIVFKKHLIKDKNIVLFDDITTTGSTIRECKKILKQSGARKILVFTIAK